MMIRAAPNQTHQPQPPTHLAACSRKWEQATVPIAVIRVTEFDNPAGFIGKGRLADELCITIRAPTFEINGDCSASDANRIDVAAALKPRGDRLLAHARKLREGIQ